MKKRGYASKFHAPKHFTELIDLGDVVAGKQTTSPLNGYRFPVTGNQIQNMTHLRYVYKQFCITGIKLIYLPALNSYNATGGSLYIPRLYYAEDKTAMNSPLTVQEMLQQDNVKILDSTKKFTHFIKNPQPWLQELDGSTLNNIQTQVPSKQITWLATTNDAGTNTSGLPVYHLHSKMLVDNTVGNDDLTMGRMFARVYYACKEQY